MKHDHGVVVDLAQGFRQVIEHDRVETVRVVAIPRIKFRS